MRYSSVIGLLALCFGSYQTDDELLAVSLIYRHGDRTPLGFAPNDPYQDPSVWPTAFGDLTNLGKRQLYELGKWLRSRYDGFLSPTYNKSEILVRSSDDDRCLMSASAKLAGLYTPKGKDVWDDHLPWQPIPVHTQPAEIDNIAEMEKSCPIFLKLLGENEKLPRFDAMWNKNEKLLESLRKQTGAKLSSLFDIWLIHDTMQIEHAYNFTLPEWALDALPQLKEFSEVAQEIYTATPRITRLSVGIFFNEVLVQFQNILNSDPDTAKFKTYSVHDTQIFDVLDALKVPNIGLPPYAAVVIYELRRSALGLPYVQILYKENASADLITISECGQKCPLEKFKEKLKNLTLTPDSYNEECKF